MPDKFDFRKKINFDIYRTGLRTHLCGELGKKDEGSNVILCGWVNKRRDHGKLIFVDLRDFSGVIQVVFDANLSQSSYNSAKDLRTEYIIEIRGEVKARLHETINKDLLTGEVEISTQEIRILSTSKTPPFMLDDRAKVDEMTKLKYRYVDLRTEDMQSNMRLRHEVTTVTRQYLNSQGFIETETPILAKSTPEGARDFLVPSRLNPGTFYALPQSPQLFKQILMFSGFDRIYQIARCFRDEDLRADRQPEFTQIDLEMSFVKVDDVIKLVEGLIYKVFKEVTGEEIKIPFVRMTWKESQETYGSDKPDLRFDMKLKDVTEIFRDSKFNIFINVLNKKGCIKSIVIDDYNEFTRKDLDDLVDMAKKYGAGGLIWIKVEKNQVLNSPISKFLSPGERENLIKFLKLKEKNLVLIVAVEL